MFRPIRTATAVILSLCALGLAGCKTIYSDVYSPRRNHFKPVQEKTKATDLLPGTAGSPMLLDATPRPSLPEAPPPAAAPEMAPPPAAPAEPAAPAIPGL